MTEQTWQGKAFAPVFYRKLAEWHEGGEVGPDPRKAWEVKHFNWVVWESHKSVPVFNRDMTYRWKPTPKRTVTIGYRFGGDGEWQSKTLVAPEVEAPKFGTHYWLVHAGFETAAQETWDAHRVDLSRLQTGHVFLTREDAQAMSDWLTKCRLGQT